MTIDSPRLYSSHWVWFGYLPFFFHQNFRSLVIFLEFFHQSLIGKKKWRSKHRLFIPMCDIFIHVDLRDRFCILIETVVPNLLFFSTGTMNLRTIVIITSSPCFLTFRRMTNYQKNNLLMTSSCRRHVALQNIWRCIKRSKEINWSVSSKNMSLRRLTTPMVFIGYDFNTV